MCVYVCLYVHVFVLHVRVHDMCHVLCVCVFVLGGDEGVVHWEGYIHEVSGRSLHWRRVLYVCVSSMWLPLATCYLMRCQWTRFRCM